MKLNKYPIQLIRTIRILGLVSKVLGAGVLIAAICLASTTGSGGYKDTGTPFRPLQTLEISTEPINRANKNAEHFIEFSNALGLGVSSIGQYAISVVSDRQ